MTFERLTRSDWNAAVPKRQPRVISANRRKGVVLHWNGPPLRIDTTAGRSAMRRREVATARAVQRFHQTQNGWSDSAYSFMVGQSGTVFEVRGDEWDQFANGSDTVGADEGSDSDFYTIMVMIGTGERPSPDAVQAIESIVSHVRGLGAGDRVLPHNAFKRKTCPGPDLIALASRLDRRPLIQAPGKAAVPKPMAEVDLRHWNNGPIESARASSYSAAVELWQRSLLASGFDPGPIDGLAGRKTMAANREFAAAVGEPERDRPTDAVWGILIDNISAPR